MGYSNCIVLICICVCARLGVAECKRELRKCLACMSFGFCQASACVCVCVLCVVNSDEVACIDVIFALLFGGTACVCECNFVARSPKWNSTECIAYIECFVCQMHKVPLAERFLCAAFAGSLSLCRTVVAFLYSFTSDFSRLPTEFHQCRRAIN